jgi:hypothetical protein
VTWLDTLLDRGWEAKAPEASKPSLPARVQAKPEIKAWYIETSRPRPPAYVGSIEPLFYFVANGAVTMCEEDGQPIGGKTMRFGEGDDPRRIAANLKRSTMYGGEDFNRVLHYQPSGIA